MLSRKACLESQRTAQTVQQRAKSCAALRQAAGAPRACFSVGQPEALAGRKDLQ